MCGPTGQEDQISDEQAQFFKTLTQQYQTVFGQNQAITGALTNAFTPILKAGPSQTGFAPGEVNALQTQNTENVATNYAQAQRATAQALAGRGMGSGVSAYGGSTSGGGNTFLPSSVNATILAQNANAAAAARSAGQNQITQANYNQGYQNWQQAASVLNGTASQLNPVSYAGTTTGAGQAAFGSAGSIAQQQFAPWGAAIGALSSVGSAALSHLGGKP